MISKKVRIIIIIATAILFVGGIAAAKIIGINKGREAVTGRWFKGGISYGY